MRSRAMRKSTRRYIWDRMKVSLWFVPLLMSLAAFGLSWLLGRVDARIPNEWLNDSKFVIAGSATEMRAMMIGMAATILATTGVVFSLLTLPLSTVAAQFGSRLLRIFLRDRTIQMVLGIFVATFSYCIATALSIPLDETQSEVPQITVTFGLTLSLVTFASLVILIQHISTMLQAPNIVAAAGAELMETVRTEIPGAGNKNQGASIKIADHSLSESDAYLLKVKKRGYIQFVDPETMMELAIDKDLFIQLLHKPGQFVGIGEIAALVWPAARVDVFLERNLRRAVQIGNQRTPVQDLEYAINQLVEVAVRAMSPAINDPFTAITCLDYLADGLSFCVRHGEIAPNVFDTKGKLRLVFKPALLVDLLGAAFDQLRHASCDNATVLLSILESIEEIGKEARSIDARSELIRHVHLVLAESQAGRLIEADKQRIRLRCEQSLQSLTI